MCGVVIFWITAFSFVYRTHVYHFYRTCVQPDANRPNLAAELVGENANWTSPYDSLILDINLAIENDPIANTPKPMTAVPGTTMSG